MKEVYEHGLHAHHACHNARQVIHNRMKNIAEEVEKIKVR